MKISELISKLSTAISSNNLEQLYSALTSVDIFCQDNNMQYVKNGKTYILTTLCQMAIDGYTACLLDSVSKRAKSCKSFLESM